MRSNTHTNFNSFVLFILLGILFSSQVFSQEITFQSQKYGVEDGLPCTEVYEIIQDKHGFMWFCTDAGVSRFNGYKFQNFTTDDGLTCNTVFHMYEDYKGRLWFLPYNNQLSYYLNDSIYAYKYNDQLNEAITSEWINSISIDTNETLKFVRKNYGFGSIDKDGNLNYQSSVASDTGRISYYQNDQDLLVYRLKSNSESVVDLFIGDAQTDTIMYDKYKPHTATIYYHKLSDTNILLNIDGLFYMKTEKGLKKPQTLHPQRYIMNDIHIDRKNQIWLAVHNNGIKIYTSVDDIFNGLPPIKHLFNDKNISGIYEDNIGGVWLAIQNSGLYYISNTNIDVHLLGKDELTNRVSGIYRDEDNNIFVSTVNSKIFEIRDNENPQLFLKDVFPNKRTIFDFELITDNEGKKTLFIGNHLTTNDGSIWTYYRTNLTVEKNDIIQFSAIEDGMNVRFNTVYEDSKNKVWIGTNKGLMCWSNNKLIADHSSTLFSNHITDINGLNDGTLLIATSNSGLIIWDQEETINYKQIDGLTSNIIRSIHVDQDDDIWISTPNGLNRLIRDQTKHMSFNITHAQGLPSNEVNCISSVGPIIWAATNKGLARFNKNAIKINETPPLLYFEYISINEEIVLIDSTYELPSNQNYLEIGFIGLSFRTEGEIVYRYKMEGIDKNWIETTTRFVRYPALSHGSYTFHLQSANEDGVWSEVKQISVNINPPYWKTTWFILTCMLAFVAFVFSIFKQKEHRQRKKTEQKKLLEREKLQTIKAELKALRTQMNPHFTFNTLSAIQTVVNRSDTAKASKYIGNFATLIRKVLENSKHPFISISEDLEMLKLYVELEQLRFSNKFSYEINTDENLDLNYHEIPSMVIQPYIENAILHGLAPKKEAGGVLKLNVFLNKKVLTCIIHDNGIGRKAAEKIKNDKGLFHESIAMEITEDRMEYYRTKTGEDYSVKIIDLYDYNDNSIGTKVELIFPV